MRMPMLALLAAVMVLAPTLAQDNLALYQPTWQIDTYGDNGPERAVGGNTGTNLDLKTCAHTNTHHHSWWAVDLGISYQVREVKVTNRNIAPERLDDFIITVSDLEPPPAVNPFDLDHGGYRRCIQYEGRVPASATVSVECAEQAIGRYLYIYTPRNDILTLCEVQVFGLAANAPAPGPLDVNLARGKYVWQSSTYGAGSAERAVDGNYDPEWGHNSVAMTNSEQHPWWAVDLGQSYQLDRVVVQSRNSAEARLKNFAIVSSDIKPPARAGFDLEHSGYRRCGQFEGTPRPLVPETLKCDPIAIGQYVYVYVEQADYLQFAEVEVFGTPKIAPPDGPLNVNLARGHPVWQSSQYSDAEAGRAVDGNFDPNWNQKSIAMTNNEQHPWWAVDLGQSYQLDRVVVTNRNENVDRLKNFVVVASDIQPPVENGFRLDQVGFLRCGQYPGVPPYLHPTTMTCAEGTIGRYVYVYIQNGNHLHLAEFEAFGFPATAPAPETNLALKKPAFGISTYGNVAVPGRAVDGDCDPSYNNGHVFGSNSHRHPWWAVDLGASYRVSRVSVQSRDSGSYLDNFLVAIGDLAPPPSDPFALDHVPYRQCGGFDGRPDYWTPTVINCSEDAVGRYLFVYKLENDYLFIAEVEVFGESATYVATQPEVNLALGKSTWQKDRYGSSSSSLAVDGNFNPDWSGGSIAMTNSHEMPWWAVDLGKSYQLQRVVVTNRNDIPQRLENFAVAASDKAPPVPSFEMAHAGYRECGRYDGVPSTTIPTVLMCSASAIGRYVFLYIRKKDYLHIAEFEAYGTEKVYEPTLLDTDLALGKTTWQISTYGSGTADLAVDGNFDPEWGHNSVAMTNSHDHPWWAVDLGQSYALSHVVVTNRNTAPERLQDFLVVASDNVPPVSSGFNLLYKSAGYRPCGQYEGNPPIYDPLRMECERGAIGRYVYILMPHSNYMHCAAFEAFGVLTTAPEPTQLDTNLLARDVVDVWQVSTYGSNAPARALDGNYDTEYSHNSCAMTNSHHHPWWAADLGASYALDRVIVTNRNTAETRLGDFIVVVTDEKPPVASGYALDHRQFRRCGQYEGTPPEGPTTMTCAEDAIGQYLYVYLPKADYLHLCEIEAYGTPAAAPAPSANEINRALGGPTWQISVINPHDSSRANDGGYDMNLGGNTCCHTSNIEHAWWAVDLGKSYEIQVVIVTGRDTAPTRLNNFWVKLTDFTPPANSPFDLEHRGYWKCAQYDGSPPTDRPVTLNCASGAIGRYLYIHLPNNDYMTICEVEAYGVEATAPPLEQNLALNRPTWQGSTNGAYVSSRAVDGGNDPNLGDNSVTHTENDNHAWWGVDLGSTYRVDRVIVAGRDSYEDRLKDFVVAVSDFTAPPNSGYDIDHYNYHHCGEFEGTPDKFIPSEVVCASTAVGRYVYIFVERKSYISFTEVEVYGTAAESIPLPLLDVNLAYKHDAWQADVYSNKYGPDLAVDGNFNPEWDAGSCAMTNIMHHPWWAVDLGESYKVDRIAIQNRDAYGSRLSNVIVVVSDIKPPVYSGFDLAHNGYRRCAQYEGEPASAHADELYCEELAIGRYVYVYLAVNEYLTICEVEVFGTPGIAPPLETNLALNGLTWQINQYGTHEAAHAVDGNYNPSMDQNSCINTQNADHAWWAVDLGGTTTVDRVYVTQRDTAANRMRNFIVVLSETKPPVSSGTQLDMPGFLRCGQYSGTPADYEVSLVQCADGVAGRYLYIYIPHAEYLQFCEVEVYAPVVNQCNLEPSVCHNGGVCTASGNSFTCACSSGWSGETCDQDMDECLAQLTVCANGGSCSNTVGGFLCECPLGWGGATCQTEVDICQLTPSVCKNGATCESLGSIFLCQCPYGWAGQFCESDIDECEVQQSPCANGGECTNLAGSFTCGCATGYGGITCSETLDMCAESPQPPCGNGGTCHSSPGELTCMCAPGYQGNLCLEDINECLDPTICKNGGTCIDQPGSYHCQCTDVFHGENCETHEEYEPCGNSPCLNGGACTESGDDFSCSCTADWYGDTCELCKPHFEAIDGMHSHGSTQMSSDYDELDECTEWCSTNENCVAFDYDLLETAYEGSRCWVYMDQYPELEARGDVVHYRKIPCDI